MDRRKRFGALGGDANAPAAVELLVAIADGAAELFELRDAVRRIAMHECGSREVPFVELLRDLLQVAADRVNRRFIRHVCRAKEHLSLRDFNKRVAEREHHDVEKASFHARCVLNTLSAAISPGAVRKIRMQLPEEFQPLLGTAE